MHSRGLVWRYYLYRMTNSAGFYLPIVIIYLEDAGFGLEFIGFSYAVFAVGTLVAEIPTGYVGDWLGRRASLAIGVVGRVGVLLAYPLVGSEAAILALHVVWAFARSFRSGTENAWLYELLQARLDADQYARIEGRGSSVLLATSAVGAILGSVLYSLQPVYPFFVNASLAALGLPLLATFSAPDRDVDEADPAVSDETFTAGDALRILRLQVRRPAVRWVVVYLGVVNAVFLVTRIYEQPALEEVGVSVASFGVVYAGFKLVSAAAAATAGWWEETLGTRTVFAALVPVYGLAYAAVAVTPLAVVPVLFLNRSVRTVTKPIRNQYLNDRLADVGRATVLSGVAMAFALVGAVARVVAGVAADAVGAVGLLPYAGVTGAVLAGLLWVTVDPVRPGAQSAPEQGATEPATTSD